MKIEYLEAGAEDCPLIRLFGNEPTSVATLSEALMKLGRGELTAVAVHDLPGFTSLSGCQLIARVGRKDNGIRKVDIPNVFECILTKETWSQVAELTLPFCTPVDYDAHQWLDRTSNIFLLITNNQKGRW